MGVANHSLADYQTLWGGAREYIDYKWAFRHEFEDEPYREQEEWAEYHLKKAKALGFKITVEELVWETSWLFTEKRLEVYKEEAERHPELSAKEILWRVLQKHLEEATQQPDRYINCGEEKYERILGDMGIRKVEEQ